MASLSIASQSRCRYTIAEHAPSQCGCAPADHQKGRYSAETRLWVNKEDIDKLVDYNRITFEEIIYYYNCGHSGTLNFNITFKFKHLIVPL